MRIICVILFRYRHAPSLLVFTWESIVMDHWVVMGRILELLQPLDRRSNQPAVDRIHSTVNNKRNFIKSKFEFFLKMLDCILFAYFSEQFWIDHSSHRPNHLAFLSQALCKWLWIVLVASNTDLNRQHWFCPYSLLTKLDTFRAFLSNLATELLQIKDFASFPALLARMDFLLNPVELMVSRILSIKFGFIISKIIH